MDQRTLGRTGIQVSPIGFGAFKIGRNEGIKYPKDYALPNDTAVEKLLNGVLDLGINYIDTAPAYGSSEERIGKAIGHRRSEFILSTKVGESFKDGESSYDYTEQATRTSVEQSLKRLQTDVLDIVFVHSSGDDLSIINETAVIPTLIDLRRKGHIRAIGFSGKTAEGAAKSLTWTDVLMVTYHQNDRSHVQILAMAKQADVGVVVKKALASGHLAAKEALPFVLANQSVGSAVIGSLKLSHMKANVKCVESVSV